MGWNYQLDTFSFVLVFFWYCVTFSSFVKACFAENMFFGLHKQTSLNEPALFVFFSSDKVVKHPFFPWVCWVSLLKKVEQLSPKFAKTLKHIQIGHPRMYET